MSACTKFGTSVILKAAEIGSETFRVQAFMHYLFLRHYETFLLVVSVRFTMKSTAKDIAAMILPLRTKRSSNLLLGSMVKTTAK